MSEKYYIVFDGKSVIGTDDSAWEDNDSFQNYWHFDDTDTSATWFDADVFLTREQVIELLEHYEDLNGKNVYEFNIYHDMQIDNVVSMLATDTSKTMSKLLSIGDYSNAELIDKLKEEEYGHNTITSDDVKRPSHYMLEDGTEVKNHIRSILGDEGFKYWAIGNAIKYVSRYKDKGKPVQDLKKAQENIQMVIDVLGEQDDLD